MSSGFSVFEASLEFYLEMLMNTLLVQTAHHRPLHHIAGQLP